MGLLDKPRTWRGMTVKNIHTGWVYTVDYAIMSHVKLSNVTNGSPLFWDYRNVRKHFVETDNQPNKECAKMYYICIADQGGKNGTVPDMGYHLPQQHLIRIKNRITNHEVEQLVKAIGRTRKNPKIIGSWGPEDDGLPPVLDYDDLNL